jgi:hypothetical protein
MADSSKQRSDPGEIVQEFQNRQKRIVLAAVGCFVVMVPLVIIARKFNPILSLGILLLFVLPLFGFYVWTYRCPACGTRVQQSRGGLRKPIHCRQCNALLDPR